MYKYDANGNRLSADKSVRENYGSEKKGMNVLKAILILVAIAAVGYLVWYLATKSKPSEKAPMSFAKHRFGFRFF